MGRYGHHESPQLLTALNSREYSLVASSPPMGDNPTPDGASSQLGLGSRAGARKGILYLKATTGCSQSSSRIKLPGCLTYLARQGFAPGHQLRLLNGWVAHDCCRACAWCVDAPAMDVVGGVIVAAGDHKDDRRGACRGRMKRGRCGSDYGSETMMEEPSWNSFHHRKKLGAGSVTGVTSAADVDLHENYELRSVLSLYRPAANPPFLAKPTPPPPLLTHSWVDPLRLLLKKELTVTDVGDLGRIILPKRDAECQLPLLDSKEGQLLSMEDYNSNKNWTLRYKWWPNNKSRMYVLESTGEFVKYYDLKEKDELIVYMDGVGNLVIRGRKWSTSPLTTDTFMASSGTKGATPTGKRSPKGANSRSHLSKSGNSSSTLSSTSSAPPPPALTSSTTTTSLQLSTSMLTTSVLSTASVFTTSSYVGGSMLNHPATIVGPYGAVAVQTDHGACIDWAKLPDPPAIEFSDPPAIEFADEFECTWGACM